MSAIQVIKGVQNGNGTKVAAEQTGKLAGEYLGTRVGEKIAIREMAAFPEIGPILAVGTILASGALGGVAGEEFGKIGYSLNAGK